MVLTSWHSHCKFCKSSPSWTNTECRTEHSSHQPSDQDNWRGPWVTF